MMDSRHVSAICAATALFAATVGLASAASQESELRTSLAQTAVVIVQVDAGLRLLYPARSAFVADAAELLPAGKALLDLLAHSLRKYRRTQIVVAVYSDAIGSSQFNQQQAQARAASVAAYLQIKGVAAARLIARGVGESAPLNAENTAEGRDLNRRLELTITPLSS